MLRRGFIKPEDLEPGVEGLEFYLDAFRELSTSRQVGMEVGAIPFTAIAEYFRIYGLEDFDEFVHIMRLMDNAYLDLNAQTNKAERDRDATKRGT